MIQQTLTVIHVDDDPLFRKTLQKQLALIPAVEYLAGFDNVDAALEFLNSTGTAIGLIILDVEMPGHNGFWLAEQLTGRKFSIIFISSHAGYAVQAFEACALNFLTKPVSQLKLQAAIERLLAEKPVEATDLKKQIEELYKYLAPQQKPNRIFINQTGSVSVISLDEVIHFYSSGNYTNIKLQSGSQQTASKTIKVFEEALQHNADFFRISRSHIVNKNFVRSIQRNAASRQISLIMKNGETLETSFKTKEEAIALLGGIGL